MNGGIFGCGGSIDDVGPIQEVVAPGPFEGELCTVTFYFGAPPRTLTSTRPHARSLAR